jgi:Zn-dependent protease with chaperone function
VLNKLKLAAIFLAIPVVCFFALGSALSDQERSWNAELQKQLPAERIPEFALPLICSNPAVLRSFDLSPVCTPYSNTKEIRTLAVAAAVGVIAFTALIMLAGIVCKANRRLLLRVFRAGLIVSNIVVSVLLLLQAAVLSGTYLYAVNSGKADDNFYFYLTLFSITALTGVFFTIKPLFKGVRKAQSVVVGRSLNPSDCPDLWEFVKELAKRSGSEAPHNLVLGLTPAFFVTEADVQCVDRNLDGRTMYLSVPLCRILTVQELSAVIAHELGHFKGADTAFSLYFYPIYRGAFDSLRGVSEAAQGIAKYTQYIPFWGFKLIGWLGSLTLLPSVYMLSFFLECFAGAENRISRDREIAADAVAAETAGAANIATALVKLVAFSGMWDGLLGLMLNSLQEGTITVGESQYDAQQFFANSSSVFALMVSNHADRKALEGLDAIKIPHPTDSHPPLSIRLSALKTSLAEIAPTALQVDPEPPASSVIDHLEELEYQLTAIQQAMLNPAQPGRSPQVSKSELTLPIENRIQTCPSCGVRVFPTSDGTCPNCRKPIILVREVAQ